MPPRRGYSLDARRPANGHRRSGSRASRLASKLAKGGQAPITLTRLEHLLKATRRTA